ncbi:MAG: hypothetical protein AAB876_02855 [Patescibacteria group bacterium]
MTAKMTYLNTRVSPEKTYENANYLQVNPQARLGEIGRVNFVADYPGITQIMSQLGEVFLHYGSQIEFVTKGPAQNILEKKFGQTLFPSVMTRPDWIFIANAEPFSTERIKKAQLFNPKVSIGIVEQTENTAISIYNLLKAQDLTPNIIFSISKVSATNICKTGSVIEAPAIPVGNIEFEQLLKKDINKIKIEARNALGIKPESTLITFIGRPDGIIYENGGKNEHPTNSLTLKQSLSSLKIIANNHKEKEFVFVYMPHPNDENAVDPNSLIDELPDNVKIMSKSQQEWKEFSSSTSEITTASDLLLTIRSTVGQTIALLGVHESEQTFIPLALHILFKEFQPHIENSALPSNLAILKMKAEPFVESKDNLTEVIEKCLFNKDFQREFRKNQKGQFQEEYYHIQPAERLWFWTMMYHTYGEKRVKDSLLDYQNISD